jgi:hypothetical protein
LIGLAGYLTSSHWAWRPQAQVGQAT